MTAVVAWCALGVSVLSLTWQVVTWLRSGARARPESGITIERSGNRDGEFYAYVSVANRGRLSTSVQELGLALPRAHLARGARHSGYNVDTDKTLPSRLDPGDRIKLRAEWASLEKWLEGAGASPDTRLRPYAVIGGRMTYGKRLRVAQVRHHMETWRCEHEPPADDHPDRRRMIG